ncbi:hypothetical protein [Hymenobacter jeollabukensis]|uniref:Uncharacterized protein n=1 Tax=Hymenobacter jeollabukensis TaxID=2025313 RepID=A0A5R8WMU7_9BACT|nr:hypothetical protein [Hymenobacter jeollabukensis]TLM91077.1 hypothetical protein FDY95_15885 [Hymenobacter jeollabukensis]
MLRRRMRYLPTLVLLLILHGLPGPRALAQQPDSTFQHPAPPPQGSGPVFVVNERLIVGDDGLTALNPNDILRLEVHKGGPTTPAKWRSLGPHGILALTLKPGFPLNSIASKRLPQLRRALKLPRPVRFELDGLPLEDPTLRIATAAIAGLEVKRPATAVGETVVNIRLVHRPRRPAKPGIYIRGTARR